MIYAESRISQGDNFTGSRPFQTVFTVFGWTKRESEGRVIKGDGVGRETDKGMYMAGSGFEWLIDWAF